ncbi:reverse transcriptase domain-containing protein, partial [Tanacetum coccineum]
VVGIKRLLVDLRVTTAKELKHQIEEAVKSGQLVHLVKGVKKKEKVFDTQLGEWKKGGKDATSIEAPILMIRKGSYNPIKRPVEGNNSKVREITFPPLRNISSADPVVIKAYASGIQVNKYNLMESEEEQRATNEEHQEEVKDILSCVNVEERILVNDQYPEQTIAIGRQLPTKVKIRLQDLLRAYADVFAWTTAHMTGVLRTIMISGEAFNTEHKVNKLKHLELVKQKKRSLAPKRNEAMHTQVEELTKANILREVKYQTWVSNPVIVKKASGRRKMCVDFTYIIKAYAYKGYHQIPIAEKDEEKTTFYTREGVFCYKRLPFGLKNAGATYYRLIDTLFNHQLGRNMEVKADDIVIKSNDEEEMLADIKETLDGLRAINLKLNPKKCSFGIEEGIFLGYLITKQGIKASPSKVKAISDLQPPKSVSEMQNLNKKLVALNPEADEAFRRMKELLEALPTVTVPIKGETLTMYLAASEESISVVLMAERGKK